MRLWESMMRAAEAERRRKARARPVISRTELDAEMTPFGLVRWYLHPALDQPMIKTLYFFELEIPAGSRSGRLRHQGGIAHLVVEGSGFTDFDGQHYEWERLDVIGLPAHPGGITFQHFNTGSGRARLLTTWPNMDGSLGPDLGARIEVLEPAPEYPG
jgi:gentisate 1,2-dioxygenase